MVSASLSVVLGSLAWLGAAPPLVPAVGLALGLNALLKLKADIPRRMSFWIAWAGAALSGSAVALAILSQYGAL